MQALRVFILMVAFSLPALAQSGALEAYLRSSSEEFRELVSQPPGKRSVGGAVSLADLLPHNLSGQYVTYVKAKMKGAAFASLLNNADAARLNKFIGAVSGGSGTTSMASQVASPAVLGFAIEHGTILQQQNGTVATLRANLLGLAEMAGGSKDLAYCAEIDLTNCSDASRNLRRISGFLSLENTGDDKATATSSVNTVPTAVQLLGDDFRMASWGLRYDITFSQNLDDPSYLKAWKTEIDKLEGNVFAQNLTKSINDFFAVGQQGEAYRQWRDETERLLQTAPDEIEFKKRLETQLDSLGPRLSTSDPNFERNFAALGRAYSNYFQIRDDLVKNAQRHKLSAEYINVHPRGQPNRSDARLIYSHLLSGTGTLFTANYALSFYNSKPQGSQAGTFRDMQLAAQLDQRLGKLQNSGQVVLTVGAYYQWMKDDALIAAATLLGTKGSIGIAQGKLTLPLADNIKIPISITWSNRTELIKERQVKGQVGLTLDLDKVFR